MTFHSEAESSFYCVWRDGFTPPVVKHKSFVSARAEAERLCRKFPGETFYVLKAEAVLDSTVLVRFTDLQ